MSAVGPAEGGVTRPLCQGGPRERLLGAHCEGIEHVALLVPELDAAIARAEGGGLRGAGRAFTAGYDLNPRDGGPRFGARYDAPAPGKELVSANENHKVYFHQLGTPQEIYDQPRSVFVARFIGGSNILSGKALDASHVALGGGTLVTSGRRLARDEAVSVSIRQHEIELLPAASVAANVLRAVVTRQVFLGAAREDFEDLVVERH